MPIIACPLPTPPATETKPANAATPVSVSFEHRSPNVLVFAPSPLATPSRPSTPSSFVVVNRPAASRSQSQYTVAKADANAEPLSSPPAYTSSSPLNAVASGSTQPPTPNDSPREPRTRTWRIEFAMEGQDDNENTAPTPYTVKVFIRFTAGALAGAVGFLASLVALLVVFAFPSLRPRGPEAATYGAGGVGVWSPPAVKVQSSSVRRKPATPVIAVASASHSGLSTPTTADLPQSALEKRVTFQLQRSDTASTQSGGRIIATSTLSPLSHEYPTTNTISINTPVVPHYLEENSNTVASGSRFMEARTNTRSPAPSQYSEESSLGGKEREKDGPQSQGGQKKFMRRFMRRSSKKDDGSTKAVLEDEREGSGYCSAPPSQPSTPIDRGMVVVSPVSPSVVEEISTHRTRRISLKLPGFKRRSIVSTNPTPTPHPLLFHAHTMPTSPDSIGNASISASESGTSNSSGITESSSGSSLGPALSLTAPSSFPSKAAKHKHAKSLSFSSISSKGPPPARSRPVSVAWKTDVEDQGQKSFVVDRERSRKLSLDDEILGGAGTGGAGALQLRIVTDGNASDAGSDIGSRSHRKAVMGHRVASESAVTVSSTSTGVSGRAKRRSVGGITLRSNSKPPVTVRPSRHEVTRRYHAGNIHTRELSHSDTEACR